MAEKGPDGGGQPEGEDVNPLPSDDVGFIPRRPPPPPKTATQLQMDQ